MSARTRVVLAAILLVGALLAASCGGRTQPNPASGAVRRSDVPAGWIRCSWSGSISRYLPLARKVDADSADSVQLSWAAQRKLGAASSDVAAYVANRSDCSRGIGRAAGPSALTWTIAYASQNDAERGYKAGVLGLPTPDPARIQPGLQVGPSTGLGADSWTLTQSSPAPQLFLAWWRDRSFTNFLLVTDLTPTDANPIALRIDAHMPR